MNKILIVNWHFQPKAAVFSYFDIGKKEYFSAEASSLGYNAYLSGTIEPTIKLLEADKQRKINLSITSPVLQNLQNSPTLINRLQKLIKAGQIELLAGQGSDSLSLLYSRGLFEKELADQLNSLKDLLAVQPIGYINPALLYSADLEELITTHKFKYAMVPRVSWYTGEQRGSVFSSSTGKLKLILSGSGNQEQEAELTDVVVGGNVSETLTMGTEFKLLSEVVGEKKPPVYNLQQLAALDLTGLGLDSLVGNNLQKDFLKKLSALAPSVIATDDAKIIKDFLWVGSVHHFRALSTSFDDRHKSYARLQTFLYDLEIRLR